MSGFFLLLLPVLWCEDALSLSWYEPFDLKPRWHQESLLVDWQTYSDRVVERIPEYDRDFHFGSWRLQDDCYNTRAKVLIRDDDDGIVGVSPKRPCQVKSGTWDDPYTGQPMHRSYEAHIDHVVPLNDAYKAGAWKWSRKKRCHYANYMENDFHLLTVSAFQNRSKGERDPSRYMPPNEEFQCTYIKIWLYIKKIWDLDVSRSEMSFLKNQLSQYRCGRGFFNVDRNELRAQQAMVERTAEYCQEL